MKNISIIIITLFLFSCGNKKELQLPEIDSTEITEITDVSAAYLFYDETQPDSVELNRKNLISTTNWLVNVDKRLTLEQAIPHIKFLQDKKKSSSHKNEKAKNYFTCHDLSENNLGFIEFTGIKFENIGIINLISDKITKDTNNLVIHFKTLRDININTAFDESAIIHSDISKLNDDLASLLKKYNSKVNYILSFNEKLFFQDYISVKSKLLKLNLKNGIISKNEFILN